MKKLLIGMIGLAAMTGGAFAANIMFDLGTDYDFSDQGSAAANGDNVYVRGGANVVLDMDTPSLGTVYLSHNTGNGTLTMDSAYSMTATSIWAGHQTQAASMTGTVNQSAGSLSVTNLYVGAGAGSGEYNMSGGTLTTGATLLNIGSKGAFNISGGTLTSPYRLGVKGTFTITGNDATINLHQMRNFENTGLFKFVFDSDGVSTITSDSWLDFSSASLSIDAADYDGGAGDFVLVSADADLLNGGFDTSKITVDGFGEEGVSWNLTQDLDANTVTFTVISESIPVWEMDMTEDPAGNGWADRVSEGSSYTVVDGVLTMSDTTLLDSDPYNECRGLTQVDLEWRAISENSGEYGAFLWLNLNNGVDYSGLRFESHLNSNDTQTVSCEGITGGAVHGEHVFSTNMLTLSATVNGFNQTADYIVSDGTISVTNSFDITSDPYHVGGQAVTLGTGGPTAEVEYLRVEANVRPDEAVLIARDADAMELVDPATTVTGSVGLEYGTVSTNLEITAIAVSDESHGVGSFNVLTTAPQTLDSTGYGTSDLEVEFDNGAAGLLLGTATGLVTVTWTEAGSGVTNDTVVAVSASYATSVITWDGGGNGVNWGDAENWDPAFVPGAGADGSATIGNGGSATVATNFTGTYAYDVIVSNSSTLNIAADLQNVAAMSIAATVNQTDGSHDVSGSVTVQTNGVLNVDGGLLDVAGTLTIADGAVVRQTGGSVNIGSGLAGNNEVLFIRSGGVLEISGGTFRNNGRIRFDSGGIFRIVGDEATVSQNQLPSANLGTYEFVLNETGVSTLENTHWADLGDCNFAIDGSAYTGVAADIVLFSGAVFNTALGSNYTVTGLGEEGVDWTITEVTTSPHTITLNILGLVEIGDITMGGVNEDGDMVFSWDTVDGQAYNVETNANLVYPNWGVYESFVGDGSPVSFTNTPALDQLFYKVTSD